jgi:DNA-binding transcriptional regulator YdaS (Cro superfamily)
MDIRAYLEKHELSQEQFAKKIGADGVSQGLVWQWLEGRTKITVERAKQIFLATDGEITPHDLLPDTFPPGFKFPKSGNNGRDKKVAA